MTSIDKAAVFWSAAIAIVGAGISIGSLFDNSILEVSSMQTTEVTNMERGANQQSAFMIGGVAQQNVNPETYELDLSSLNSLENTTRSLIEPDE